MRGSGCAPSIVDDRDFVVVAAESFPQRIAVASLQKQNPAHLVFSFTQ